MTETTIKMNYKWCWELHPDKESRELDNLLKVEWIISKKIYTTLRECLEAALEYGDTHDMPDTYGPACLTIVHSKGWWHDIYIYG